MRKSCAPAAAADPSKPRSTIACRINIRISLVNFFRLGSVVTPVPEIIRVAPQRRLLPIVAPRLEQAAGHGLRRRRRRRGLWRDLLPALVGVIGPPGDPAAVVTIITLIITLIAVAPWLVLIAQGIGVLA